jgi:CubicO group peptidase (beta-lactamase class C family)
MNASAFANMHLFGPLDLGDRFWYSDNRGISYGGVGLCIGIHDMIQIGSLYLNKGSYEGRQLVPSDWIQKVTGFKVSTGNIIPFLSDYGYFWWLGDAHGQEFICANGYGGQFIFIIKDLNLVVCSRTNYRGIDSTKAGENWYMVLDIIINQVLTAVKDPA